ncbi:MAG: FkbM family methyltransferase [Candidatus Acidiferrales bacterium]
MPSNARTLVSTITMDEIPRRADNNFIDLLKIDIEGAERGVFSGGAEWLQRRVGLIVIEPHDRFKPGCAKAFYDAIAHFDFVQSQKGENLFVWLSGRALGATGQTVSAAYP